MRFRDTILTVSAAIVPLLACTPLHAHPVRDGAVHAVTLAIRPLAIVQQGHEFIIAEKTDPRPAIAGNISIGSAVTFDRDLVHRASPLAVGEQNASDQ